MQFRDLQAQYNALKPDIDVAITRVLAHGRYIGGPEVVELEDRLARYVGVKHCVSCGNGTDAIQLALMAWGVGEGDAVFVPDFTFFASGEAPALLGATPVFVDVDERTFNLDPAKLEEAVRFVEEQTDLKPKVFCCLKMARKGSAAPSKEKWPARSAIFRRQASFLRSRSDATEMVGRFLPTMTNGPTLSAAMRCMARAR